MSAQIPQLATLLLLALPLASCTTLRNYRLLQSYEITLADSSPQDSTVTDVTATVDGRGRSASLLSAFYGLDDGLPKPADRSICDGAAGQDGMPVIFSHELAVETMQAADFRVVTASGGVGEIRCVTLAPADDPGELRTALLVGQYGSVSDPPAEVQVVGNLLSSDGAVNFKGMTIKVTALEEGPTLVMAELVPEERLGLGTPTALPFGGGSRCPAGTRQVVNVTWAGGITKPGGDEADDRERQRYKVTLAGADGGTTEVVPAALADLGDGDNNHKLCLDASGTPRSVSFPAGLLTDPRDDPNPDTSVDVITL
jgi:hypothetical protein